MELIGQEKAISSWKQEGRDEEESFFFRLTESVERSFCWRAFFSMMDVVDRRKANCPVRVGDPLYPLHDVTRKVESVLVLVCIRILVRNHPGPQTSLSIRTNTG